MHDGETIMINAPLRRDYIRSRNAHKRGGVKNRLGKHWEKERGKTLSEGQELKERVE